MMEYDSSRNDLRKLLLAAIRSSKTDIRAVLAWFTDMPLIEALNEASRRGVDVKVIVQDQEFNRNVENLYGDWVIWAPPIDGGITHHKFAVFDKVRTFSGSANWTKKAFEVNGESLSKSKSKEVIYSRLITFSSILEKIQKHQLASQIISNQNLEKQEGPIADLQQATRVTIAKIQSGVTINQILCSHTRLMGCSFEWRGAPCEPEKIFADDHLMAAVTTMASIKGLHLANWNLGVSVKNDPAALLRTRSEIPLFKNDSTNDTMRALFFIHSAERIFGISGGKTVECFPVYEYFNLDLRQRALMASTYAEPVAQIVQRKQA